MIQDARSWCTGMTQKDGMGREVGEGLRMGNTCNPVADSCQCMAKPVQYCKLASGMTQKDGMGREAGVGFRMGNTCTLMVDSSQCMAKPIQYCKVK